MNSSESRRYVLKLDEKGRITVPQAVRELIGLEPGMFVELVADTGTRTLVVKPITTGVLATYKVSLRERSDIVNVVSLLLEEGSELRYLECRESECVVGVFLLDVVMVERIAEKLQERGIQVVEYLTK